MLDFWINTTKSTRTMLTQHQHMGAAEHPDMPSLANIPGASPQWTQMINERENSQRETIKNAFLNMSDADLMASKLIPPGASPAQARALLRDNMDVLVDEMQKMTRGKTLPTYEVDWYKVMKVFVPPDELIARHPGFGTAFGQVRNGTVSPALTRQVRVIVWMVCTRDHL